MSSPVRVSPEPATADEAAAITAALTLLWPAHDPLSVTTSPAITNEDEQSKALWRFSTRGWAATDRWAGWLHL